MSAPRSLRGQDLRTRDLSAVRLAGADLRAVDLREADLRGLDFSGADLRDARLDGAHLQGALLRDCELGGASFEGADLRAVDLRRSTGFGLKANWARMEEARLDGAEWRFAELRGAVLDRARGTGMRLDRADMMGASLQEAWLPGLVLDDAILEEADLRGAYLRRAALVGVAGTFKATGADLRRADLLGVSADCLEGAKLQGARRQGVVKRIVLGGEELQKVYRQWAEARRQMADLEKAERARLEEQRRLEEERKAELRKIEEARLAEERRLEEQAAARQLEEAQRQEALRRLEETHRAEARRMEEQHQSDAQRSFELLRQSEERRSLQESQQTEGRRLEEMRRIEERKLEAAEQLEEQQTQQDLRLTEQRRAEERRLEAPSLVSEPVRAASTELPVNSVPTPENDAPAEKTDLPPDGPVWTERLKGAWSFIRGEAPNPDAELRLELRQVTVRQETREREGVLVPGEALPEVTHRLEHEALEEQDVLLRARVRKLLVDGHTWQIVEAPDLEGRLWVRQNPKEEPAKIPERAMRPPPPPDASLDAQARLALRRYQTTRVETPAVPESLGVVEPGTEIEPVEVPKPAAERPEAIPAAALIPPGPLAVGLDTDARAQLRRQLAKHQSAEAASERARLAATAMEDRARRLHEERDQAALKALEEQEKQKTAAEERAQQLAEERARAARERARLAGEARQIAEARLETARKAAERAAQAFRALMAADPDEAKEEPSIPELGAPSIDTEAGRLEVRRQLAQAEQRQRREATAESGRQLRNTEAPQDLQRRQLEAESLANREAELRAQAEVLAEQRRLEELEAQAQVEQQRLQLEEARRERERLALETRILAEQKRRQAEADSAERENLEFEVQQSREVRRSAEERGRALDAEAERFLAEVVRDIRAKAVEVSHRINQLLRQQQRQDDASRLQTAQHNEQQRRLRQQLLVLSPAGTAFDPRRELRQEQVAEVRRKRRELLYQRIGSGVRRSFRTVAASVPGGVNFVRARLARPALPAMGPGADLRGLHLEDADLRSVDLEGAQLERVSLVGADLRGANLRGANLRDADLSEARLSGADLTGADLTSAVLDQTIMDGALLEGAILDGALLDTARGLDPALRRARGDSSEREDRWARATSYLTVGSLAAAVVLYLGVNWQNQTVDLGDLEQAAGEAQRTGNTDAASENFAQLAARQELPDSKINFLLEAAASAEESKDYAKVLGLLEEAIAASEGGAMETTVRLRLARAQARGNLTTAAENSYRLLLSRIDLEPVQQAEALVGLASVVSADKISEIETLQKDLLKRSATDLERGSVALALADGWSSTGHPDNAQAVVEAVLSEISDSNERATLRLRLGRLMVENGDSDGALALYRQLISGEGTSGLEARLGAAELLMKRGNLTDAGELLGPLLEGSDDDRRARALIVSAAIAGASDDSTGAVAKLQEVLAIDGISNQRQDEARLALGRLLVRTDPEAAAAFAANNPMLKEEMLLGQARALRESGDRRKARELWVQLSDDPTTSEEARTESQLALSDLQLEEGDADGALARYQQLLEVTTTASLRQRVVLGMADALLKLGKLQEAETKYDGLIPVSSPEVALRCQLGLARAAEMRGQLEKASRLYLQVSQEDGPGALEALLSLGELRERNGDLAGSVEALRLARTRVGAETERRTEVDIALARVLQMQGTPEAATLYAQLLEAPDPDVRVQARLAVGEQRLAAEPEAALKLFDEAESQATRPEERADARAGWMRAMVLLGKGDEAVERARAWLAAESDSARKGELALAAVKALRAEGKGEEASTLGERYREAGGFELAMELAGVYQDRGNLDASIRALQGAVAKEPEDKVWQAESLLDVLLLAGRWTEADAVCTRLSTLPGGDAPARFGRARVLREQGKLEESLAMLADLDDPRVPMERAELLQALGRDDESEVLFRRMLLSNDAEQRTAGRVGLARILLERGDAATALETLDGETVTEGYALTAAEVRGEAFLALNKVSEAQAVYGALDGDAEARVVRALGLGDCALAAENPVAARGYFEQALGSVDRFYQAQALAGLVRTAAEAGDPSKAGELLQKLRKEYPDHEDAIVSAQSGIGGQ